MSQANLTIMEKNKKLEDENIELNSKIRELELVNRMLKSQYEHILTMVGIKEVYDSYNIVRKYIGAMELELNHLRKGKDSYE